VPIPVDVSFDPRITQSDEGDFYGFSIGVGTVKEDEVSVISTDSGWSLKGNSDEVIFKLSSILTLAKNSMALTSTIKLESYVVRIFVVAMYLADLKAVLLMIGDG
jgi:hypothetical protein